MSVLDSEIHRFHDGNFTAGRKLEGRERRRNSSSHPLTAEKYPWLQSLNFKLFSSVHLSPPSGKSIDPNGTCLTCWRRTLGKPQRQGNKFFRKRPRSKIEAESEDRLADIYHLKMRHLNSGIRTPKPHPEHPTSATITARVFALRWRNISGAGERRNCRDYRRACFSIIAITSSTVAGFARHGCSQMMPSLSSTWDRLTAAVRKTMGVPLSSGSESI